MDWSKTERDAVEQWIRTGSLIQLGELLQYHPTLIGHPAVFNQLEYLHRLAWTWDTGDLEAFRQPPEDDAPPAGTRKAAGDALRGLLERFVQGLLWPGWRLVPPRNRPGRRPSNPIGDSVRLLSEYEDLLALLRQQVHRPRRRGPLSPKERAAWEPQLAAAISKVWQTAETSKEYDIATTLPADFPSLPLLTQLEQMETLVSVRLLPPEKVRAWAHEVAEMATEGPIRDRIAYELLGYSWGLTKHQVRGRIQAARRHLEE
jgi:hypothetical protein